MPAALEILARIALLSALFTITSGVSRHQNALAPAPLSPAK